ncbi:hypothetical protein [Lactococcus petauri]|uniref:hypothetical protein n=1 Tax=Lactococcus petauri TaxID=1940789 RepID=UPI0022E1651D|nr:hypothetical protein [Lactococcus petauri]
MTEKLEMRELCGDDLFTLLDIFAKLEIQDDIVEMFKGVDTDDMSVIEARGMALMTTLISKLLKNVSVVKVELNSFLGELTGKTAEEIGHLGLATYAKLVKDFATKPELKDFFQSLSS